MSWQEKYSSKLMTAEQAAATIVSGDIVSCGNGSAASTVLSALAKRIPELENVKVYISMAPEFYAFLAPQSKGRVDATSYFFGPAERAAKKMGSSVSYAPIHLSDVGPTTVGYIKPTVATFVASPPDESGKMYLGHSPGDVAVLASAKTRIAEINDQLPLVHSDVNYVMVDDVDILIDNSAPLSDYPNGTPSAEEQQIAEIIAERVLDGSCIQLGIGGIATATGKLLVDKKDLGIHTEMFVESMVDLIECGAVTNAKKQLMPGVSVFGFAAGSQRLYKLIDNNPKIVSRPFSWVNDPRVVCQNDNFVSINSAMQVDLSGQVCAESIGFSQYSGTGGQADFVRGAKWSKGGQSFIALTSTRKNKDGSLVSKISPALPLGSAVTTLRSDVHHIVTEYGIATLRGASIDERARRLIAIAHPQFREELTAQAKAAGLMV